MHFAPATAADVAALRPSLPSRYWRALVQQTAGAHAWTLWRGEERVAVCGVDVLKSGILECWLLLANRPKPTVAALRFILLAIAGHFPDRAIICRIDDSNRAGRNMATMAGFVPLEEHLEGTRIRTWLRPPLPALPPETLHMASPA